MAKDTTIRIAGFVAALLAVFGLALLAGAVLDPRGGDATAEEDVAEEGFRLVPAETRFASGSPSLFRFRVVDAAGRTVRDFDVEHERRMHLIVIRRDFAGFQHLHPRQLADGSWAVDFELPAGGVYRAFADFSAGGRSATLATDLFASGEFRPEPLPAPTRTAAAGDGYEVALDSTAAEGDGGPLRFTVSQDGQAVESVQPYLGADGHLVVLREHDLAFLHVHPVGEPGGAGPISFEVAYPGPGRYRLFLQLRHGGEVRTAAFTQDVGMTARGEEAEHGH